MSLYAIGNGFGGSSDLEVSTEEQEIIPSGKLCYKLKFYNQDDCHIVINGIYTIFLGAFQGFETNEVDTLIRSFVITEAGININYVYYIK